MATRAPADERSSGVIMDAPEVAEHRERLQAALGEGYALGELIGRGGFGAVYAALDVKLARDVAVKALRHDVFPTPSLLERFQREARAVAGLRHPNILPVHTVGEGEGIAFMVMPLVEGESLHELLEREGTLPVDESARIVGEVAAALEAAHKRGIVHRDVKPANVMLEGEERRVLLMDFGIAKAATDEEGGMTGTGVVVGSPRYMSPEQAAGETDIDGRSDIYSLGAVAFEMLSGRPPHRASSLHELVYKQVTEDVTDLAVLVPGAPDHVVEAVMRSLASDREDRWQTSADLRRAVTADGASTRPPGRTAGEEEESWLSLRGPYVLLLLFLLSGFHIWEFWMRDVMGPEVYRFWTGGNLLEFASIAVVLLLIAAAADLLVRLAIRLYRGYSLRQLLRYVFGQPSWWQTWYPRGLRVRDSVWDRLPFSMKLLRTLVWLELVILPAGGVLVVFVVPTIQAMMWSAGREAPLAVEVLVQVVHGAAWAAPVVFGFGLLQLRDWQKEHGIPSLALLGSLFELRGSHWQGSPARAILRD